jgi:hypothetical protein
MLTIDFEFHTLIAASTSLCHNHEKNSKNRVRTEFLCSTAQLTDKLVVGYKVTNMLLNAKDTGHEKIVVLMERS